MILSDIIRFASLRTPNAPALVFDNESFTYAELSGRANRLSNALLEMAHPGDRVAILAENCVEYVEAYYGVTQAGMILTLLNYRLTGQEIAAILEDCGPRILITEPKYLQLLYRSGLASLVGHILLIGSDSSRPGIIGYQELTDHASPTPPNIVTPDDNQAAWLIYTSGTTGNPKGVKITNRNLIASACNSVMTWERSESSRTLMPWPLCHMAGYSVFVAHMTGRPVVLMRRYDPKTFLELIQIHRITDASGAPTMLKLLLECSDFHEFDVASIERLSYGSAPISQKLLREVVSAFPNARFMTGFGMTETSGNALHQPPSAHLKAMSDAPQLLGSVGRPMPLIAARIVNDRFADVRLGEVGELVLQGPQVTEGYWNDAKATAELFTEGWLHTGDLARQDHDGNYYIVDRMKDMVVTGGENVFTREVEDVIQRHPCVSEVAVLGVSDETWGEAVVAVVQVRGGMTPDGAGILALCNEHLAGYKTPKRVVFVDHLPKNAVGKVLKRELRRTLSELNP